MLKESLSFRAEKVNHVEGDASVSSLATINKPSRSTSFTDEKIILSGYLYISHLKDGDVWVRRWCDLTRKSLFISEICTQRNGMHHTQLLHSDLLLLMFQNSTNTSLSLKYRDAFIHIRAPSPREAILWVRKLSKVSQVPLPMNFEAVVQDLEEEAHIDVVLDAKLSSGAPKFSEFKISRDIESGMNDDANKENDNANQLGAEMEKQKQFSTRSSFIRFFKKVCQYFRSKKRGVDNDEISAAKKSTKIIKLRQSR